MRSRPSYVSISSVILRLMALQPRPEGYTQAKEELLTYCCENEITFPLQEYEYIWADTPPQSPGAPSFSDIANSEFDLPVEEPPYCPEDIQAYINDAFIHSGKEDDILDTRKLGSLCLDMLVPRPAGPDYLRKFGPKSLETCVPLLPKEVLYGEHGMDISTDTSQAANAFVKDSKLSVTQEQVGFLREFISGYSNNKSVDIILSKVNNLFLPLICSGQIRRLYFHRH